MHFNFQLKVVGMGLGLRGGSLGTYFCISVSFLSLGSLGLQALQFPTGQSHRPLPQLHAPTGSAAWPVGFQL